MNNNSNVFKCAEGKSLVIISNHSPFENVFPMGLIGVRLSCLASRVTRKKLPNIYKSCPKMN